MDIIKKLQLNKNPKDIKTGSIVGAKNIMLDPVSSFITNEYGFSTAYTAPSGFKIVGCISCNEEICIFLYNETTSVSKIQRLKDGSSVVNVNTNWQWEGGEVFGTFSYNYKGQLILAVSEKFDNYNNKQVPLKVWNLDDDSNVSNSYNLEEEIPKFDISYNVTDRGFLTCGTYTFFIRFKIANDNYTKWFQVTDDVIIIDVEYKDKVSHLYKGGTALTTYFSNLLINSNRSSNRCINFNLSFDNNTNFNFYQIGYIVKRNSETLGRLLGEYNINVSTISFSSNEFVDEINIDDFLEEPHQFFNVKNLINYNNRLYISNYSEYKVDDYQTIANHISITPDLITDRKSDSEIAAYELYTTISYREFNPERTDVFDEPISDKNYNDTYVFLNNYGFISSFNLLASNIQQLLTDAYEVHHTDKKYCFLAQATCIVYDRTNHNNYIPIYYIYYSSTNFNEVEHEGNNSLISLVVDPYNQGTLDIYLKQVYNGVTTLINLTNAQFNIQFVTQRDENLDYYLGYYTDTSITGLTSQNTYTPSEFFNFVIRQSEILGDVKHIGTLYNNDRTLIPGQVYNFFAHFVRKDLSITPGYRINNTFDESLVINVGKHEKHFRSYVIGDDSYFQCPCFCNADNDYDYLIVPKVSLDKQYLTDNDLIGFFISYEVIEKISIPVVPIRYQSADNSSQLTNTKQVYNLEVLNGYYIIPTITNKIQSSAITNLIQITSKKSYTLPYRERNLDIEADIDLSTSIISRIDIPEKYTLIVNNTNLYKSKNKVLYQLTPILFVQDGVNIIENNKDLAYRYLPSFCNYEKVISYSRNSGSDELVLSPVSTYNYDKDGNRIGNYNISVYSYKNYSDYPLNCMSIKQDYEMGALSFDGNVVNNKIIAPSKLPDFLEIKQAYISKPLKSYTNYSNTHENQFDKTIYRSDVISDESLNNGFRHFSIENYKNITENKGKITNIIGIGLYLLVHTEYSIFVFDRNNQLTSNSQLQIPDVFDIDYKELTPSGEGFGGLKNKEESILTKHGYIWFDRISKSIFIFDGQQIKSISADIHVLLKNWFENPTSTIIFAEDYISNRLIITLRQTVGAMVVQYCYVTLSYSFDTEAFISSHDYTFDKNYRTYNNSYIFNKDIPNKLFVYRKVSYDYCNLDSGKYNLFEKISDASDTYSYVDILFNDKYELTKVLNSISYVMSKNNNYNNYDYQSNEFDKYYNLLFNTKKHLAANNLYSGFKLIINTDCVTSGELDISQNNKTGNENDNVDKINPLMSKAPHWDQGIWNFNNFRQELNKAVTEQELDLIHTVLCYNPETREYEVYNINSNELKEAYHKQIINNVTLYDKSDMRSLIFGKYFIFRFIFERRNNLNLKFETLDININKYK